MVRIGVIGLGYWGPNLVRCLQECPDCQVVYICDRDSEKLRNVCNRFPEVIGTTDDSELLRRDRVDAVVVATPTKTHYQIARRALSHGLHTFVEKPLATSRQECAELIEMADVNRCVLFVGHVFLYSAAVAKLKEIISKGELGDICYISSTRLNLGPVRRDVNALWDLAPHDTSIILELMGHSPETVSCSGLAYLDQNIHDVCNLTMRFSDNRMGIVHVSWLDPHKRRVMTIVGSKKMAVYNDVEPLEKIRIYDNGVEAQAFNSSFGEFLYSYRYGDIYSPRVHEVEPLKAEARSFVDAILTGRKPKTDGWNGLRVVEVIEAAEKSLNDGGGHIRVNGVLPPSLAAVPINGRRRLRLSHYLRPDIDMSDRYNHPTALVETDQIGPGTRIWAFAHVMSGARIGSNCNLGDHAFIEKDAVIGNNVTLKNNVCIWAGVIVADDVFVGPNVAFTNDRWPRSPRMDQVRARYERQEHWLLPTIVERGVSIGANATILPGIRLGRYCMIGAGAVVTNNVPPFALVIGSPARRIADVCRCGQRLNGCYRTASCEHCGEAPQIRCQPSELVRLAI